MIHEGWERLYIPEPMSGCWLWLGDVSDKGYAVKGWYPAYRLFWEMCNGPTPEGMCCCHTCDNPMCVNPEHIFLGTTLENMRDKVRKGRCQDQRGERGPGVRLTLEQVEEIVASTESQRVIGERHGISQAHVSRIRSGQQWSHLPRSGIDHRQRQANQPGENNKKSKLTVTDVLAIRESSEPRAILALRHGVSIGCISLIQNRQRWRHV